jgi:DNA-binding NarL/FixJ family response regulator
MEKIKLMLADDHQLFLDGLKGMLEAIPGIEITATAGDGEEVLRKLKSYYIDILLLDISMPKMNGIETAREIHQKYPGTKIIVLSMHNEKAFIQKMYQNNVYGYLLKTNSKEELLNAIRIVYRGEKYFSPELTLTLLENNMDKKANRIIKEQLSKREKEILILIANGQNNPGIAEELHLSIHTVNTHRKNILLKLGVNNTAGLVNYAMRMNLLE